jgi:hypothetical protein
MRSLLFIVLFIGFVSNKGICQTFISDSVAYVYVGNLSDDNGKILLRQFGLKNYVTKLPQAYKTEIIRDGDLISLKTPQGPVLEDLIPKDFKPWRIKIVGVTIQNRTDVKKTILKDGTSLLEQTFFGESDMEVYNTDNETFIPLETQDSPNVTIIWQLIVSNRNGEPKQLRFHLINSRDICEIIYCHPR